MDILSNIWDWVTSHKKTTGAIVGVFLFILLMVAANNHAKQKQLAQQKAKTEKVAKETQETEPSKDRSYVEGTDAYLMSMQPELRKSFGTPPEGFIWDLNGKGISLGDK